MAYSDRFFSHLGLAVDVNEMDFLGRLDEVIPEGLLSGLVSVDTRQSLLDNFGAELDFDQCLTEPNDIFKSTASFHEIRCSKSGDLVCQVLELYKIHQLSALASDGQQLLLLYIATEGDFEFPLLTSGGPLTQPPFARENFNVSFLWKGADSKQRQLIKSIYAPPKITPFPKAAEHNPHISASLSADGFYSKLEEFSILQEAIAESRVKWRFLLLYRILENGYIRNLLESIQDNIFFNPKDTLNKAVDTLQNEFSQLNGLIEKNKLGVFFEKIQKIVHRNKTNSFLTALNDKLGKDGRAKSLKPAQQGAFIIYQVRCSIVHAGEMSLFFDKYADAEAGLMEIYDLFDYAVFKYLGIEFKA